MVPLGIAITFLSSIVLVVEFFRHQRSRLAIYGWVGLIGLATAESLMFRGFQPVAVYFTPIAWTCYILLADAAVSAGMRAASVRYYATSDEAADAAAAMLSAGDLLLVKGSRGIKTDRVVERLKTEWGG